MYKYTKLYVPEVWLNLESSNHAKCLQTFHADFTGHFASI